MKTRQELDQEVLETSNAIKHTESLIKEKQQEILDLMTLKDRLLTENIKLLDQIINLLK